MAAKYINTDISKVVHNILNELVGADNIISSFNVITYYLRTDASIFLMRYCTPRRHKGNSFLWITTNANNKNTLPPQFLCFPVFRSLFVVSRLITVGRKFPRYVSKLTTPLVASTCNRSLICRGVSLGNLCSKRATAPATVGQAMEVPLIDTRSLSLLKLYIQLLHSMYMVLTVFKKKVFLVSKVQEYNYVRFANV